jgi:hypothetical protein
MRLNKVVYEKDYVLKYFYFVTYYLCVCLTAHKYGKKEHCSFYSYLSNYIEKVVREIALREYSVRINTLCHIIISIMRRTVFILVV